MKQRLKWMTTLLIVLLFVIVLAACGGNSEEASGTEDDGKLKLVAGTEATYAPMEYIDENGEIVGIDIDIVNAIAEEIGAEVEFQNIGWDPLFPAVKNGEIDFAVSSIDRKSTRLNSSHVAISYAVFCLKKKTKNI